MLETKENMNSLSKEIEGIKKSQMKILGLKTTITKIKSSIRKWKRKGKDQ